MYGQVLTRAIPLLQRLAKGGSGLGFGGASKINQLHTDVGDRMTNLAAGGIQPPQPGPFMGQPQTPPAGPNAKPATFDQRFGFAAPQAGTSDAQHWPKLPMPQPPNIQGNPFPTPMNGNPFPDPNANGPQGPRGYNPHVGNMSDAGANTNARQVMDPASGQMMNDFYSKSFPSFFNPNVG